jgi:NadR type nicotinamide-nucleotide adenylyltransferase
MDRLAQLDARRARRDGVTANRHEPAGARRLLRVCVTGPESTGKTTLAGRLAEHYHTAWVPEASRLYAESKATPLLLADVVPIARQHVSMADDAIPLAHKLLVLDTDLLSTVVYSRHYYGVVPPEVEELERARRADLYLLCDVDVPWLPDGVRDRPTDRQSMFELFREALDVRSLPWTRIHGNWDARWETAVDAVDILIGARRS